MPNVIVDDELNALVEAQVRSILGDPAKRAQLLGTNLFGANEQDMLEKHDAQLQGLLADNSLGRILNGPVWLSGASVLDGTITAPKISVTNLEAVQADTGTLNVTGNFTAAASFPAVGARIVINSAGLWGYSGAASTTFKLNTDGSGEIGTGANKVTWTTAGVLSIPAAVIQSLTIAAIGGGNLGGTYATSGNSTRIEFGPSYFRALSSGVETFKLDAATGALTATGTFTIKSAASGARVEISNAGGIAGYNAANTQTFLLNAATGAGQLGASGLTWDSNGAVSIHGSLLVNNTITASKLSVTSLSAISADLGTITAGSINAASVTVTNLNASNITSGSMSGSRLADGTVPDTKIASVAADKITAGTGVINALTVKNTLTLGSGGKIIDSDGSYWDQGGIVLNSTSGLFGDNITWRVGGSTKGSIYATSSDIVMASNSSGGAVWCSPTYAILGAPGDAQFQARVGVLWAQLPTANGSTEFLVRDSLGGYAFGVASNGALKFKTGNPGIETGFSTLGSVIGRVSAFNASGSFIGYMPVYNSIT